MGYRYDGAQKRKEISKIRLEAVELEAIKNQRVLDPENEERRKIHELIRKCVSNGISAEEILERLKAEHNNPNLSPYYEGYIKHEQNKQQKLKDHDEGR